MASNYHHSSSDDDDTSISSSSSSNTSKLENLVLEDTLNESVANLTETNEVSISSEVKGANKNYFFEKTYSSMVAASQGILNKEIGDQLWTRGISYETKEGDKICYTCRGFF